MFQCLQEQVCLLQLGTKVTSVHLIYNIASLEDFNKQSDPQQASDRSKFPASTLSC